MEDGTQFVRTFGNTLFYPMTKTMPVDLGAAWGFVDTKYALPSRLFITPPPSLNGLKSRASINTLTGDKIREAWLGSGREFAIPIDNLARGRYVFELKGAGFRRTEPFDLPQLRGSVDRAQTQSPAHNEDALALNVSAGTPGAESGKTTLCHIPGAISPRRPRFQSRITRLPCTWRMGTAVDLAKRSNVDTPANPSTPLHFPVPDFPPSAAWE